MSSTSMGKEQFVNLCSKAFGGRGWQKKAAEVMGCSAGLVSQIKTGSAKLSPYMQQKLLQGIEKVGMAMEAEDVTRTTESLMNSEKKETDQQISDRLAERWSYFRTLIDGVARGAVPSLIVSGPAGLGKTHTVRSVINDAREDMFDEFPVEFLTGVVRPTGLFHSLYLNKDNGVVVLDDCDEIFQEENSLNILKGALDSTEKRLISYKTAGAWLKQNDIPDTFEFKGSVIFLTNLDFEKMVDKGSRLSPHFEALLSRCLYLPLGLNSRREIMIRIEQIAPAILENASLSASDGEQIISFMKENLARWRHLSLREIYKLAQLYKSSPATWKKIAEISLLKKGF